MTTPRTAAGKALLDDCERDFGPLVVDWRERIAAIEAEATAAATAQIAALRKYAGFLRSVILSGETLNPADEAEYRRILAATTPAEPANKGIPPFGDGTTPNRGGGSEFGR